MLKAFLIIFREFTEISILLGIIIAATREVPKSRHALILGTAIGAACSILMAIFAKNISNFFHGLGQELLNIIALCVSIFMIGWTLYWVKSYSVSIKRKIEDVKLANNATMIPIVIIVASSIFREGAEIFLFLYNIIKIEQLSILDIIYVVASASISGMSVGIFMYKGLIKFSGKYIFKITTIMLIFVASALSAEVANQIEALGILEGFWYETAWDSSFLIPDHAFLGQVLKIVVGYTARPNFLQVIFYNITFITIYYLTYLTPRKKI